MEFDGFEAKDIADKLSIPRIAGSKGEKNVRSFIVDFLKSNGYSPVIEEFDFSLLPVEFFLKFMQIMVGALAGISIIIFNSHSLISISFLFFVFLIIFAGTGWSKFIEFLYDIKFKTMHSANIIASKVADNNYPSIFFLAHYDSKSQSFPIILRISLNIIGLLFVLISTFFVFFALIFHFKIPDNFAFSSGIFTFLPFFILLFNFTGNKSPGAVDNASGVALVLELAKILKQWEGRVNLHFLFTGAEELGLAGAIRFIQKHEREFNNKKIYFVNFDGISAEKQFIITAKYGFPPRKTSAKLHEMIVKIFEQKRVKFRSAWLLAGAGVDSIPIGSRGYESITISCGSMFGTGGFIHSKKDVTSLLSPRSLSLSGGIAVELLNKIEEMADAVNNV